MGRLRVGYIVPSLDDTTGWGRWTNDFLREAGSSGIDMHLWMPQSSKQIIQYNLALLPCCFDLPELFDYVQSSKGIKSLLSNCSFFIKCYKSMKLDIIHSLDAYPWGIYGKFLASKLGIPHIMTAHGRYGFIANYRLMDRILYKRILEDCSAIVAVSAAVKKEILKYFSNYIEQENIHVLHNAVNISGFKIIDNKVPIERNDFPTIISVTRFIACKGIETSLRAFKIVRSQIPNSQYLLVGPGNHEKNQYYRNITELIRTENINGVKIVGRVSKSDLSRYYISSDLLLHTPITLEDDFEAYGLILLEAGLFKLPVVATRSGGVPEVIENGWNGLLADEKDYKSIADLIITLIRDKNYAKELGQNNYLQAAQKTWLNYWTLQKELYHKITEL